MAEPKFTPGPWYVGAMNDALFVIDQPPRPSTDHPNHKAKTQSIAIVTVKRDLHAYEANANLMAAAPELYDACRAALSMVETDQGPPNWDLLRAALAKAEGRA
jgi:hypothetical protein